MGKGEEGEGIRGGDDRKLFSCDIPAPSQMSPTNMTRTLRYYHPVEEKMYSHLLVRKNNLELLIS